MVNCVKKDYRLVRGRDFKAVRDNYIEVVKNTPRMEQYARWIYGMHPTDEMIRSYVDNGDMYILKEDDNLVGMIAIVMHQDDDYKKIDWSTNLDNHEVSTLHILAICPEYRGKHLARVLLDKAIELSKENGKKAIRLDVLRSNTPAQGMYEDCGFEYRGTQKSFAENTGWTDFVYYELPL